MFPSMMKLTYELVVKKCTDSGILLFIAFSQYFFCYVVSALFDHCYQPIRSQDSTKVLSKSFFPAFIVVPWILSEVLVISYHSWWPNQMQTQLQKYQIQLAENFYS